MLFRSAETPPPFKRAEAALSNMPEAVGVAARSDTPHIKTKPKIMNMQAVYLDMYLCRIITINLVYW